MRVSPFPTDPLGVTPAAAIGELRIRGVLAGALNTAIAVFDREPLADDSQGQGSATNPAHWTAVGVDPTIDSPPSPGGIFVPPGEVVPTYQPQVARVEQDINDGRQFHVVFKGRLESRVRYDLTASTAIRAVTCEELTGTVTHQFRALRPGPLRQPRFVTEDRLRDLDFQFFPTDPNQPDGTWRFDKSGDIAIQNAQESLRKRLLRRLETQPGGFSHLGQGYGLPAGLKRLATPAELQTLANRVAEQARLEPDVLAASANVQLVRLTDGSTIVRIALSVRRQDQQDQRFEFDLPAT